ncbi:sensor domain-containing diguanylate cyclase [Aquitalea sp. S1-19]|nr:sensor domain-containing diguanylate cyclase [Aquitalea sp. S1-19]
MKGSTFWQPTLLLAYAASAWLGYYGAMPFPLQTSLLPTAGLALLATLYIGWRALPAWLLTAGAAAFLQQRNLQATGLALLPYACVLLPTALLAEKRRLTASRAKSTPLKNPKETTLDYHAIAEATPFPLLLNRIDDGVILYANPRARQRLFGTLAPEQKRRIQDFYAHVADRERNSATLMNAGSQSDREIELVDAAGQRFWALVSSNLLRIQGELLVLTGINDIGERKQLEVRLQDNHAKLQRHVGEIERLQKGLREQAFGDALTGVFNRRHLEAVLPNLLKNMHRESRPLGLMMFDVDHFKKVNDTYGHKSGDLVLAAIGKTLRDTFRGNDIICRYGGEEFVVLLPGSTLDDTEMKAGLLRRKIEQLQVISADGKHTIRFTISIGVSAYPQHGKDNDTLLRAADDALYRAKEAGRNRVQRASTSIQITP